MLPYLSNNYLPVFLWGLVTLGSLLGWGALAVRALQVDRKATDGALLAGWGMAVALTAGGLLASLSLASRPVIVAFTLAGFIAGLLELYQRRASWGGALLFTALLAIWYAPSVALRKFNPPDDFIAYLPFVRRLLYTGTLLEPFSLRRLATYGGQAFLHATTMCVGSEKNANLLELGLAPVIIAGLMYGYLRKRQCSFALAAAVTAALLLLPNAETNIMSQTTGIALFLALFRTLSPETELKPWQRAILSGVVAAGLCSLRSSYFVAAAVILVGGLLFNAALGLLACGVCLAPWMLLLYRSSGSLLYPLMLGNQRPEFNTYSSAMAWPARFDVLATFMMQPNVAIPAVAAVLFSCIYRSRASLLLAGAALTTELAIGLSFNYTDQVGFFRYVEPIQHAAFLAAITLPFGIGWRKRPRLSVGLLILLSPYLLGSWFSAIPTRLTRLATLPAQIADRQPFVPQAESDTYRQLQAPIPSGETMLAILDKPSLLDYSSSRIINIDVPGAASFAPGMPFFKGPQALKEYAVSHAIRYIAYTDFDSEQSLYNRSHWKKNAAGSNPLWRFQAPYYLDLMDNVDSLARSEHLDVNAGTQRLIRLP